MGRVLDAVRTAVASRPPSPVVSVDELHFTAVGLAVAGWPHPSDAEVRWVRALVGDLMATRESEAFR
jgi:hypothetical protein